MNYVKNIHFTLIIRINNRLHEFNFRKRNPELYDTDTSDDRGNRFYFKMIKEEDKWNLHGNNLPAWIVSGESSINESLANKESAAGGLN